jgi:hypothetical protein
MVLSATGVLLKVMHSILFLPIMKQRHSNGTNFPFSNWCVAQDNVKHFVPSNHEIRIPNRRNIPFGIRCFAQGNAQHFVPSNHEIRILQ